MNEPGNENEANEADKPVVAVSADALTTLTAKKQVVNTDTAKEKEDKSQTEKLLDLCGSVEFFHTPKREPFATVPVWDHYETLAVDGKDFEDWLTARYFSAHHSAPHPNVLKGVLGSLKARALFQGQEHPVFLRIGESKGKVYVDLGDARWRVIEVSADNWKVLTNSPVKFRRAPGMLALPEPVWGGSLEDLRPFVNVADDDDWALVKGFLIGCFSPTGPYPLLEVHGQHGSAKSTLSKVLRLLVDPNTAPARGALESERDLVIAANNGWLLVFDNLSEIKETMSNALCRISTGGAFSTRKLFSDKEEILFEAERPMILNGIEDLARKADLLDRAIVLELPPLEKRRVEADFWADFEEKRPKIFGAILSAVSRALNNLPRVADQDWPRMADFAKWVTAAEGALGPVGGQFLNAYRDNRGESNQGVLEGSPVARTVLQLMENTPYWKGTASQLRAEVEAKAYGESMPRTPSAVSGELRQVVPNLKEVGITVTFDRQGKKGDRVIEIRKTASAASERQLMLEWKEVA